jgi:hypothetical protein
MAPFSNPRTRRNTTFVAMLVWAFALASGMANACLLATQGQHAHIAAHKHSDAHHAHAHDMVAADAVTVDHDDETDASKKSCLKACDDGSNAQIKLQTGVDLNAPGLAPFVVFAWDATTPVTSVPGGFDELQVPLVGPPFRLRYSRLTL